MGAHVGLYLVGKRVTIVQFCFTQVCAIDRSRATNAFNPVKDVSQRARAGSEHGHHVGDGVIRPQHDKVTKILNAPAPSTKKEVRSFIGLINYYRVHIPHFASKAAPLTDLTKKGQPNTVVWAEEHERAFNLLKSSIAQDPILRMPDFAKSFYLQTDASDRGAGGVLMQDFEGKKHPIAYFSCKFSDRQRRYSTVEKECLAVVMAIKRFQLYLYGTHFILETDHEPLTFIDRAKMTNSRIMRWSLFLQNWRFTVRAIKGVENVVADYLSHSC